MSGSCLGEVTHKRFSLPVSPEIRVTLDFDTLNMLARKAIRCLFALPSTGGAVILILRLLPIISASSSFEALGCTLTRNNKFCSCH